MFVIYSGDNEMIVTTPEQEAQTIKDFFVEGDRDLSDYLRCQKHDSACVFSSRISDHS